MNDLFDPGMTRRNDRATSEKAAAKVAQRKPTIRRRVLLYSEQADLGFIDENLRVIDPDAPESSIRKRRSELTAENIILDSGRERMNSKGSMATVWIHRKFHPNPPPEIVKKKGKAAAALQRTKREAIMWNALVEAAKLYHRLTHEAERAVAEALGIDYPIRVTEIPAKRPL